MTKYDFSIIVGKEQRRKMKKIVQELSNYRILANLRPNVIAKIFHYMKKMEFRRGKVIYKEGESTVDSVYFIIQGEF